MTTTSPLFISCRMSPTRIRTLAELALFVGGQARLAVQAVQQNQQEGGGRRRRRRQKPRRFWVSQWLLQRERLHYSHYYQLIETLRNSDPDHYKNFTRLEPALFNELLQRIHHRISRQRTWYRDPLDPGLKLAVTLRHLATGNS